MVDWHWRSVATYHLGQPLISRLLSDNPGLALGRRLLLGDRKARRGFWARITNKWDWKSPRHVISLPLKIYVKVWGWMGQEAKDLSENTLWAGLNLVVTDFSLNSMESHALGMGANQMWLIPTKMETQPSLIPRWVMRPLPTCVAEHKGSPLCPVFAGGR